MKRLAGADAMFLNMETPAWHQHVAGLTILDPAGRGDFSFDEVVSTLSERIMLTPKFCWKLKEVPLQLDRPIWVEDSDFRIDRHIRRVAVRDPGGKHETAEMLGQIVSHQLDRSIPLWEFWFLEGLRGGRVGTVLKFHHCLLDGMSGASLASVLMDLSPDGDDERDPEPAENLGSEPSSWELLARSFLPNSQLPITMFQYGGQLIRRGLAIAGMDEAPRPGDAPTVPWNAPVGPRRSAAFSSVSLDDVRSIKQSADVKVNDVVLALCSGAMRSFLRSHDDLPDTSLKASCPVSVRAEGDDELSNQISNMMVSLATDIDDPAERLERIGQSSRSAKEMTAAMRARKIQSLGETAPPLVLNQAIRAIHRAGVFSAIPTTVNTIISNVPGPPMPLYLAGARVTGIYPGSIIVESMGLNVTVISYVDRVDFGFAADPDLVPDLWDLAELVPSALAELMSSLDLGEPTAVEDPFGE